MARDATDIMSLVLLIPPKDGNLSVVGYDRVRTVSGIRAPRMDFQYWPQSVKSTVKAKKVTGKRSTMPFSGVAATEISMQLLLDNTMSEPDRLQYHDEIRSRDEEWIQSDDNPQLTLPGIDSLSLWTTEDRFVATGGVGDRELSKDKREFFLYGEGRENVVVASIRFLTAALSKITTGIADATRTGEPTLNDKADMHPAFYLVWTRSDPILVNVAKFDAKIFNFGDRGLPQTAIVSLNLVEATITQVENAEWLSRGGPNYYNAYIERSDGSGSTKYIPPTSGGG